MKNSSLNLVFQKCRSVHHQHWSEWHNYLHIAIYRNPRYPRVCGVCQAVLHSLTAWIMPFVSVNEIQHVAIQMRLPQWYSTNCKDWKSYLEVWRFKLNIFPSTLFFNFFQREIFYYIEILFYFNVNNFQEWKGSFQSFFFQRCPLEQIVLKVKLFDIGPPKAVLRLALQPPDPDDIERTVLLLKQVKRKKNLKCCHVTDLGAEPLFVFLWVRRRKMVTKAWTFWTSESCSWLSNWFSKSRMQRKSFL